MEELSQLEPKKIWAFFSKICSIPRLSKKEEKIIAYLKEFSEKRSLNFTSDNAGNVLISKSASLGNENRAGVVLQSHLDMVCEKNSGVEHDFYNDPIRAYIDGSWVKARGTTLGADCGIGIAAQLAILDSDTISHGPLECLFTVDEETGLTGAFALESGFMKGKTLINLDSEDEGELFIGCAGGIDTIATFSFKRDEVPKGYFPIYINISGLLGGHSGDDIDKGRGNAIKILSRFLWDAYHKYGIRISSIDGGNLRNAIPREAQVLLIIQQGYKENLVADFNVFKSEISDEYSISEPGMKLDHGTSDMPETIIDDETTRRLIDALFICPNGVQVMSSSMPGMVETSTNLASVKINDDNRIQVTTSQRSDRDSGKIYASSVVEAVFENAGATVKKSDGYPGWKPNPQSNVLAVAVETYEKLFGHKPIVRSIHAGLECGLFLAKYPDLDMVSFGPTIKGAHSPDERLNIETVDKFWKHLVETLKVIK